ncbi:hypothetical protein C5E07_01810 [Pseudoclavibacter sp. RFBJ3]|uniref:peptidoglycan DD-metalloendopeptidase family protein n=1 Tax=unclassified Pseudoclavibacter TaxID=2615177 RepID=UPI000CE7D2EB|nr:MULTISPECIES: peptidoglycan DD-metalloendopeptidase family protein [unclassified Pseudoclavibacter]MBF4550405.1 peptidoglycan DD-metalloendopeptidase family protein [Pseudoclavibacter sp. VKM Ac-2888]PPF77734.1 hypothetical protein C5B99_02775 [Pseudoclavibacter sp. Z016]PPF81919.1 hypothetical protein C5C12_12895 [Pseudoclavibacter sp. RFBJ5]PPF95417.1 hypothetical protein C5E07_01810 [Pseudoclavibacter sp. RFBJ3]PPF95893.1 hypothetical protein C5C19_16520 [Pseudoclavibacter sp. RFBH5]
MPATRSPKPLRLRNRWRTPLVGAASAAVLAAFALAAGPAFAADDGYATWEDVVAAEGNVDRQEALISEIEQQIADLDAKVTAAAAQAKTAGEEHGKAQTASSEKFAEVTILQDQADAAEEKASTSREKAGQLAAAMSTRGAGDPKLALFLNPGDADTLLYQLGTISKLSEQTDGIYNQAVTEKNTADVLGTQATTAHDELAKLESEAKTKFDTAQAEQVVLQNEKYLADSKKADLQAMLAPLKEKRDVTATDYAAGEKLRQEQVAQTNRERAEAAAAYQEEAYAQAVAEAEAAGVQAPPKPDISSEAPAVNAPLAPADPTDTSVAPETLRPPQQVTPPRQPSTPPTATADPTAPVTPQQPTTPAESPAPAPSQEPVTPQPTTAPEPTAAPEPSTPAEPQPTAAPTAAPEPEPTKPDIEILPEEPQKPDVELEPEPEPEPEVVPPTTPETPNGVLAGYYGPISSGVVTDEYGMRLHPIFGTYRMHNGLDLGVNGGTCGAPLYAVHSGTITYAGYNGGFGNHVVLDFGNGTEVSYSHIMDGGINVYVGQTVNAGDVLAYAGTTGSSTGCHLHFELKYWGTLMDPKPWLASAGIYYY